MARERSPVVAVASSHGEFGVLYLVATSFGVASFVPQDNFLEGRWFGTTTEGEKLRRRSFLHVLHPPMVSRARFKV